MEVVSTTDLVKMFNNAISDEQMSPYINKIMNHFKTEAGGIKKTAAPLLIPMLIVLFLISFPISIVIKIIVLILFIIHVIIVVKAGAL